MEEWTISAAWCGRWSSLHDDPALRSILVKFAEEFVDAGLERADEQHGFVAAVDDLFPIEVIALEFFRRFIQIPHHELGLDAGGHRQLGRLEPVILDGQGIGGFASRRGRADQYGNGGRPAEQTSELKSLMRTSYAVFCFEKKVTQAAHVIHCN